MIMFTESNFYRSICFILPVALADKCTNQQVDVLQCDFHIQQVAEVKNRKILFGNVRVTFCRENFVRAKGLLTLLSYFAEYRFLVCLLRGNTCMRTNLYNPLIATLQLFSLSPVTSRVHS